MNAWERWKKTVQSLEKEISTEKGEFALFALFRRDDATDKYDLLVSAPWIEADQKQSLEYLAKKVQSRLDQDQFESLSRIVLLDKGNPVLEAIRKSVQTKHSAHEVQNTNFSGVQITQACISTSSNIPPTVL